MNKISEKDKKTIDFVLEAYKSSANDLRRLEKSQIWDISYKQWKGILPHKTQRRSNLFIPVTLQTIETMVAREVGAIFGQEKLFEFIPNDIIAEREAEILSKYSDYDIRSIPSVYHKVITFLRILHIKGTAILKPYWDYDRYTDPLTNELKVKSDRFSFKVIDPRFFFIDPTAKTMDDAKWCIEESIMDIDHFKTMMNLEEYKNLTKEQLDTIKENRESAIFNNNMPYQSDLDLMNSLMYDDKRKFVKILEYWDMYQNRYIVIAGEKIVVRDSINPFDHKKAPYVAVTDIQDPECFYGISTVETISDLQSELNSMRNHRMDKFNFTMNPMYKAKYGSIFNRKDLIPRLGGVIHMKDVNDLVKIDMGDMKSSDYNEIQEIKYDMQTTTSISDFSMGTGSQGFNETATGISIVNSNADARIVSKVSYIEQQGLIPLAYFWLSLQAQFGKTSTILNIFGETVRVDRRMLSRPYFIKAKASTQILNKQAKINQLMQLSQIMLNNPSVNMNEFLKLLVEAFGYNASKLINNQMPFPVNGVGVPPGGIQGNQQAYPGSLNPSELGNKTGTDFISGKTV